MAEPDSTPLRTCTKCSLSKPHSEYTKVSRTKIGLSSQCKACQRIYYEANAERIKRTTLLNWNKRQEPKRAAKAEARAAKLALPNKRCGRCGETKLRAEFGVSRQCIDGLKPYCKLCNNQRNKEFRESNPESAKASSKKWTDRNPHLVREKSVRWYWKNQDKALQQRRDWRKNNKQRLSEWYTRYCSQINYRLHKAMSSRMRLALKGKSGRRTFDLLGFSIEELRNHIERQFLKGMSWENYGSWHIDHIVPLVSFKVTGPDDPELRRAWALTNLRPLWAKDNLRKSAKLYFLL